MPITDSTFIARFWSKVDRSGDCWIWGAYVNNTGYGIVKVDGRCEKAHRIAYQISVGPIPDGLTIDHLCRNKTCVNPAHMEPVTIRVNVLRGGCPPAQNARRTHCPSGHPYSGGNLYVSPRGWRYCRACQRAYNKARKAKIRASTK